MKESVTRMIEITLITSVVSSARKRSVPTDTAVLNSATRHVTAVSRLDLSSHDYVSTAERVDRQEFCWK